MKIEKLPGRFEGKKHPKVNGYKNINVTSASPHFWRQLSPMLLGPIYLTLKDNDIISYDTEKGDMICYNLENFWQGLKFFPDEVTDGMPNKEWHKHRNKIFESKKGIRRKETIIFLL